MAGSLRKSIGLNLALTLMAWGFFPFYSYASNNVSPTFIWQTSYQGQVWQGRSPKEACLARQPLPSFKNHRIVIVSQTEATCTVDQYTGDDYSEYFGTFTRHIGVPNPCDSPYTFDSSTGMCTTCPSTQGQTKELKGPEAPIAFSGGAGYVMWSADPDVSYCVDSCSYSGAVKTACYAVSSGSDRGYCNFMVGGEGDSCDADSAPLASVGAPITAPTDPVDPPDPDPGDNGGGDTGGGNNGGGGGNSGSPVTPPDPVDIGNPDAATTGDVASLGNRLVDATYAAANGVISAINGLGNKVDGVGDKVDGLGDKIDALGDSLQGDEYSEGEGEGASDAESIGQGLGDSLSDLINQAVDDEVQKRSDAFDEDVAAADDMVSSMFGDDPSGMGGSILEGLFPSSAGCSDFTVRWHNDYAPLILPVCELTRLKSILEWVFGILAGIFVWRTLMATLNQSAINSVRSA